MVTKSYLISLLPSYFKNIIEFDAFFYIVETLINQLDLLIWNEIINNSYVTINAINNNCNRLENKFDFKLLSKVAIEKLEKQFSIKDKTTTPLYLRNYNLHSYYTSLQYYTIPYIQKYLQNLFNYNQNYKFYYDRITYTLTLEIYKEQYIYKDIIYDFLLPKLPLNLTFNIVLISYTWKQLKLGLKNQKWKHLNKYLWKNLDTLDLHNPDFYIYWKEYKNIKWNNLTNKHWNELGEQGE